MRYGKIDHERLTSLLKDRLAELPLDEDPNALVESYETITSSVLDEVCPLVTKTRTVKPKLPWYNQTIHEERRIRRRVERRWKKTRTESDETAFIAQKDYVTRLITNAKIDYFTESVIVLLQRPCTTLSMYFLTRILQLFLTVRLIKTSLTNFYPFSLKR